MATRLVLGCGPVGQTVLGVLSTWAGELHAVVSAESRAEALREETVDAIVADPADPEQYPPSAETVFVVGSDVERCAHVVETARSHYPDALLVAVLDTDPGSEAREAVERTADRVVDVRSTLAAAFLDPVGGSKGTRTQKLRRVLRSGEGTLAVVTHDNPDPDAIGSAIAMVQLARSVGRPARACYFGDIAHQENRALVNLLDIDMRNLESPEDIDEYGGVALVDHSRPGVNDGLSTDTVIEIVVDHHPPRAPVEGRFVDLRSDVGATSTLLAGYLGRLGLTPDRAVATALLYGIRVDTREFTRGASEVDFEAASELLPYADQGVLEQVETPSMNADVLETIGRAIRNRTIRDEVLVTGVGSITNRDALSQAAERLLDMEGIHTTVVYGFVDETVYVSGRTRGVSIDLGETFRDALDPIGSAGGHADMAGAQIPLGILAAAEASDRQSLSNVVDEVIQGRLFESLASTPPVPAAGIDPSELAYEFSSDE